MKRVFGVAVAIVVAAAVALPAAANAAGPPLPKAANGKKVVRIASGIAIPTQFTWGRGDMFIAGGAEGKAKGGIYVIRKGTKKAVRIKGSPKSAFGVKYKGGKLYASLGSKIVVYGKWDGKRFLHKRTILKANRKNFTGFNGIEIAPNGRIYTGMTLQFDHAASTKKYANAVISVKKSGKGLKIISKGIRQPWQLTFLDGEKQPIGTALGQDGPKGTDAADFIFKARPGANFGFPKCTWGLSSNCDGYTKPIVIFPAQSPSASPTGITHRGQKLFVGMFGGIGKTGPEVVSMDKKGKKIKDFVTGFVAPVVGVGVHKGHLYAGDLTSSIYKVKL